LGGAVDGDSDSEGDTSRQRWSGAGASGRLEPLGQLPGWTVRRHHGVPRAGAVPVGADPAPGARVRRSSSTVGPRFWTCLNTVRSQRGAVLTRFGW